MEESKRIVEFSVAMRPTALLRPDGQPINEPQATFATRTGMMIATIMTMTPEDRAAYVAQHCTDPLVVWWAMLTPHERRDILKTAEEGYRQKVTE